MEVSCGEVVGIDGKTVRGSRDKKTKAIHMVSAWASVNRVVLGQLRTCAKSNAITAIPTLLDLLDVQGCIVTLDAMGCQKAIVEKIVVGEADYCIGLKGNQESLHREAQGLFENSGIVPVTIVTEDKSHDREETREYSLVVDIDSLSHREVWAGLKAIGRVRSSVLARGKVSVETRYFITSVVDVVVFSHAVRSHWGIENGLHWCLDVVFREDSCRTRKDNSAENFSVIRHIVLSALNRHPAKMALSRKRRRCYYDEGFLLEVLAYME